MPTRRVLLASAALALPALPAPLFAVAPAVARQATPVLDPTAIESERDVVYWMWSNVGPWALTFFEKHLGPVR